ncbi:hypothetical protein [Amycolatopsis azurea]|uniref:Uncharacterized protein n=1 Tax=Amycolatopsis azurea DSM 43854 TaxID=1238180 RepID=M2QK99_9PSEU|nr:hypothetical protein [Amycolatopsis azurea]EMD26312.1 hypothetical protein C791_3614 [Amycolatopsis azurea DSM 43854]OOC07791.1 hypothetical protein B0293_06355 [Amycolatopsis azurea DSM 43854]
MTFEVVGLCRREPDADTLVSAIRAASPLSEVDVDEDRMLFLLRHPDGGVLLAIESGRLVRVPGETRRLLGVDMPSPVWWVEGRARDGDPEAETAAREFAASLVATTGGTAWSSR